MRASLREDVGRFVRSTASRTRQSGRRVLFRTLRLTAAAVVSYAIVHAIYPQSRPLTGPLTAILVVQATLYSTLTTGIKRVGAVVSGVVLAVLFSSFVGLTWWSLGVVVAAAIAAGYLLRLREFVLETPISAMLVLGLASPQTLAVTRVVETLVGAGVGVLLNVVLPPPWRVRDAATGVERVATYAGDLLDRVAAEAPHGLTYRVALDWLQEARGLSRPVERADRALVEAAESRRLNVRAAGTHDPGPILRSGLDALEHSVASLRALFRSLCDAAPRENDDQPYAADLQLAFAALVQDLAATFRAYGHLIVVDAGPAAGQAQDALAETLDSLREARARLSDLLTVDAGDDDSLWLLRGPLLAAVQRVLDDLDVEERARRRRQWTEELNRRGPARQTAARVRRSSRHSAELPRDVGHTARQRAGRGRRARRRAQRPPTP